LPQQYCEAIGERASVFETEYGGKQAFLIVRSVPHQDTVLKPSEESLKPSPEFGAEARISQLESEIEQLKEALVSNESEAITKLIIAYQ
jgi:hypothetical protein